MYSFEGCTVQKYYKVHIGNEVLSGFNPVLASPNNYCRLAEDIDLGIVYFRDVFEARRAEPLVISSMGNFGGPIPESAVFFITAIPFSGEKEEQYECSMGSNTVGDGVGIMIDRTLQVNCLHDYSVIDKPIASVELIYENINDANDAWISRKIEIWI